MEWNMLINVLEVCSFMGLAIYYRWFIAGFFEDRKSDYGIAEEEQEVCLDQEMRKHFRGSRSC
jgi:hypothetical protein